MHTKRRERDLQSVISLFVEQPCCFHSHPSLQHPFFSGKVHHCNCSKKKKCEKRNLDTPLSPPPSPLFFAIDFNGARISPRCVIHSNCIVIKCNVKYKALEAGNHVNALMALRNNFYNKLL